MPPSEALKRIWLWGSSHFLSGFLMLVIVLASQPVPAETADYLISLVRHGDRAPRCLGNQSDFWPMGAGQLTDVGIEQMRQLGQEIRRRHFGEDFPEQWFFTLSHHYSKGINRTVQSAAALLQGVYPPIDKPSGVKGSIQIPPVYASTLDKDFLFSSQHLCAGYVHLIQQLEKSAEWQTTQKEYEQYLKKWRKLAGVNGGIYPLASFLDRVTIHASYGLPLPDGVTADDAEKMKDLLDWLLVQLGSNLSIAQLIATPVIRAFIKEYQQVASCVRLDSEHAWGNCPRWVLFLGSDINLITVMTLLGISNNKNVDYGSHLEIQLNRRDFEPEITLYFNQKPIDIPGCKAPCLLDRWLELLEQVLPESWDKLCDMDSGPVLSGDNELAHPVPDSKKVF